MKKELSAPPTSLTSPTPPPRNTLAAASSFLRWPWKAKIPFDSLRPRYEFPEAVNELQDSTWEDDEKISKRTPWNDEDYKRLRIKKPLLPHNPENDEDETLPDDFYF